MANLILVRHGESTYNAQGIWAGWDDPELTEKGKEDAKRAATALKNIQIDAAFTSDLKRQIQTLDEIKDVLHLPHFPTAIDRSLRERNYGIFTGKNKWQIKEQLGDEEFKKLRRGWDYPIDQGESLKQVYNRVIPFYINTIMPLLEANKNVLIVSSGNTLRALIKLLDNIQNDDIANFELAIGDVYVYTIDKDGNVVGKEVKMKNSYVP